MRECFNDDCIPQGMLSSPQIKRYIKSGLLIIIPDKNKEEVLRKQLKSATYDMRLGDKALICKNDRKQEIDVAKNNLYLEPNSLTFVTIYEDFNLPKNVIARFNLKVKLVHKGLLLGTGPIVDPEFKGKLFIPIHNFSSQGVQLYYLDSIISVEFTKTLDTLSEDYVENKHKNGNIDNYIKESNPTESSVYKTINELKKKLSRLNLITYGSLIAAASVVVSVAYGGYQLVSGTNARIDGVFREFIKKEEIYQENKELTMQLLKKIELLEAELDSIKKKK